MATIRPVTIVTDTRITLEEKRQQLRTFKAAKTRRFRCVVPGCNNEYEMFPHLTYYRFPRQQDRAEMWLKKIRREDLIPKLKSTPTYYKTMHRVCMIHFEECYLGGLRLSRKAVPKYLLSGENKDDSLEVEENEEVEISFPPGTANSSIPIPEHSTIQPSPVTTLHALTLPTSSKKTPHTVVQVNPVKSTILQPTVEVRQASSLSTASLSTSSQSTPSQQTQFPVVVIANKQKQNTLQPSGEELVVSSQLTSSASTQQTPHTVVQVKQNLASPALTIQPPGEELEASKLSLPVPSLSTSQQTPPSVVQAKHHPATPAPTLHPLVASTPSISLVPSPLTLLQHTPHSVVQAKQKPALPAAHLQPPGEVIVVSTSPSTLPSLSGSLPSGSLALSVPSRSTSSNQMPSSVVLEKQKPTKPGPTLQHPGKEPSIPSPSPSAPTPSTLAPTSSVQQISPSLTPQQPPGEEFGATSSSLSKKDMIKKSSKRWSVQESQLHMSLEVKRPPSLVPAMKKALSELIAQKPLLVTSPLKVCPTRPSHEQQMSKHFEAVKQVRRNNTEPMLLIPIQNQALNNKNKAAKTPILSLSSAEVNTLHQMKPKRVSLPLPGMVPVLNQAQGKSPSQQPILITPVPANTVSQIQPKPTSLNPGLFPVLNQGRTNSSNSSLVKTNQTTAPKESTSTRKVAANKSQQPKSPAQANTVGQAKPKSLSLKPGLVPVLKQALGQENVSSSSLVKAVNQIISEQPVLHQPPAVPEKCMPSRKVINPVYWRQDLLPSSDCKGELKSYVIMKHNNTILEGLNKILTQENKELSAFNQQMQKQHKLRIRAFKLEIVRIRKNASRVQMRAKVKMDGKKIKVKAYTKMEAENTRLKKSLRRNKRRSEKKLKLLRKSLKEQNKKRIELVKKCRKLTKQLKEEEIVAKKENKLQSKKDKTKNKRKPTEVPQTGQSLQKKPRKRAPTKVTESSLSTTTTTTTTQSSVWHDHQQGNITIPDPAQTSISVMMQDGLPSTQLNFGHIGQESSAVEQHQLYRYRNTYVQQQHNDDLIKVITAMQAMERQATYHNQ